MEKSAMVTTGNGNGVGNELLPALRGGVSGFDLQAQLANILGYNRDAVVTLNPEVPEPDPTHARGWVARAKKLAEESKFVLAHEAIQKAIATATEKSQRVPTTWSELENAYKAASIEEQKEYVLDPKKFGTYVETLKKLDVKYRKLIPLGASPRLRMAYLLAAVLSILKMILTLKHSARKLAKEFKNAKNPVPAGLEELSDLCVKHKQATFKKLWGDAKSLRDQLMEQLPNNLKLLGEARCAGSRTAMDFFLELQMDMLWGIARIILQPETIDDTKRRLLRSIVQGIDDNAFLSLDGDIKIFVYPDLWDTLKNLLRDINVPYEDNQTNVLIQRMGITVVDDSQATYEQRYQAKLQISKLEKLAFDQNRTLRLASQVNQAIGLGQAERIRIAENTEISDESPDLGEASEPEDDDVADQE
jgi:hypothetical protein